MRVVHKHLQIVVDGQSESHELPLKIVRTQPFQQWWRPQDKGVSLCFPLFTFSAVVAAARQGCFPSNSPRVTRPGRRRWPTFKVKMGVSICIIFMAMPMASNYDWNHHLRANTAFNLHKGGSLSFVRSCSICWCLIYAIYHKNFLQVSARIFKNLQGSASFCFCKTTQLRTIWRSEAGA